MISCVVIFDGWCLVNFLTCKISDFTPCAHAQSNILNEV